MSFPNEHRGMPIMSPLEGGGEGAGAPTCLEGQRFRASAATSLSPPLLRVTMPFGDGGNVTKTSRVPRVNINMLIGISIVSMFVTFKINYSAVVSLISGHTHLLVENGLFLIKIDQGREGVVHGGQHRHHLAPSVPRRRNSGESGL